MLPAAYSVTAPYVEAVLDARLAGILAASWPRRCSRCCWSAAAGTLPGAGRELGGIGARGQHGQRAHGVRAGAARRDRCAVGRPLRQRAPARWVPALALAALTTLDQPCRRIVPRPGALAWRSRACRSLAGAGRGRADGADRRAFQLTRPHARHLGSRPAGAPGLPRRRRALAAAWRCAALRWSTGSAHWSRSAPGPSRSNVERLALLFAGMALLAASWLPRVRRGGGGRRRTVDGARRGGPAHLAPAGDGARGVAASRRHSRRPGPDHGASRGRALRRPRRSPRGGRVLAARGRGWERQVDVLRDAPLYSFAARRGRATCAGCSSRMSATSAPRPPHPRLVGPLGASRAAHIRPAWLTLVYSASWSGRSGGSAPHGRLSGQVALQCRCCRELGRGQGRFARSGPDRHPLVPLAHRGAHRACIRRAGSTTEVVVRRPWPG